MNQDSVNSIPYEYFAFISYKREDEKWAKWLQKKLESYSLPTAIRKKNPGLPNKIRPVFRDQSELAGGNLKAEIEKGLNGSKYLIVICSPRSAKSPWVSKEVQHFIDQGREESIIPFIIGGTPNASKPEDECFPEGLRQLTGEKEILGININEMGRDAAAIKVIARMFNLRFDLLWQRFERAKKKIRLVGISILLLILSVIVGFAYSSYSSLKNAQHATSLMIAEKLDSYLKSDNYGKALDLAFYASENKYDSSLEYLNVIKRLFSQKWIIQEYYIPSQNVLNINNVYISEEGIYIEYGIECYLIKNKSIVSSPFYIVDEITSRNGKIIVKRMSNQLAGRFIVNYLNDSVSASKAIYANNISIIDSCNLVYEHHNELTIENKTNVKSIIDLPLRYKGNGQVRFYYNKYTKNLYVVSSKNIMRLNYTDLSNSILETVIANSHSHVCNIIFRDNGSDGIIVKEDCLVSTNGTPINTPISSSEFADASYSITGDTIFLAEKNKIYLLSKNNNSCSILDTIKFSNNFTIEQLKFNRKDNSIIAYGGNSVNIVNINPLYPKENLIVDRPNILTSFNTISKEIIQIVPESIILENKKYHNIRSFPLGETITSQSIKINKRGDVYWHTRDSIVLYNARKEYQKKVFNFENEIKDCFIDEKNNDMYLLFKDYLQRVNFMRDYAKDTSNLGHRCLIDYSCSYILGFSSRYNSVLINSSDSIYLVNINKMKVTPICRSYFGPKFNGEFLIMQPAFCKSLKVLNFNTNPITSSFINMEGLSGKYYNYDFISNNKLILYNNDDTFLREYDLTNNSWRNIKIQNISDIKNIFGGDSGFYIQKKNKLFYIHDSSKKDMDELIKKYGKKSKVL